LDQQRFTGLKPMLYPSIARTMTFKVRITLYARRIQ
jgi:hypothetical protein